jgi:hypothetical protein
MEFDADEKRSRRHQLPGAAVRADLTGNSLQFPTRETRDRARLTVNPCLREEPFRNGLLENPKEVRLKVKTQDSRI